jgi:hypothetical protein
MQSRTGVAPGLEWEARPHSFAGTNCLHHRDLLPRNDLCGMTPGKARVQEASSSDQEYFGWNGRSNCGPVHELISGLRLDESVSLRTRKLRPCCPSLGSRGPISIAHWQGTCLHEDIIRRVWRSVCLHTSCCALPDRRERRRVPIFRPSRIMA